MFILGCIAFASPGAEEPEEFGDIDTAQELESVPRKGFLDPVDVREAAPACTNAISGGPHPQGFSSIDTNGSKRPDFGSRLRHSTQLRPSSAPMPV